MIIVGKTVESYRIALEGEISRWNGFIRALRKDDREAFEEMMDMGRGFASEAGNATNPILFEPFIMSILLAQQKRILTLEKKLGIKQYVAGIPEPEQAQENWLGDIWMTGFSSTELPEEFKQRLNSLSEKLNRINGNLDQSPNNTEAAA